jgi:nucleoid-associated protein YejK
MNYLVIVKSNTGHEISYFYEDFKDGTNPLDRVSKHMKMVKDYKIYPTECGTKQEAINEHLRRLNP